MENDIPLNNDYLKDLECQYSKHREIRPETSSNNCSVFRISLYITRELLFKFVRETFKKHIRDFSINSEASIKQSIWENVRINWPTEKFRKYGLARQDKIKEVPETQFKVDWRTFARCYTGSFLTNNPQIDLSKVDKADPKDLLENLRDCFLFSDELSNAAGEVICYRNKYYAHLDMLLIDSSTLEEITFAIETFQNLISAKIDYDGRTFF